MVNPTAEQEELDIERRYIRLFPMGQTQPEKINLLFCSFFFQLVPYFLSVSASHRGLMALNHTHHLPLSKLFI